MKYFIFVYLISVFILINGCTKGTVSSQIIMCPGTYYLEESLNEEISNDEDAFNILKEGKTYDSQGGQVWIEDRIPLDMNVNEALDNGLFRKNQKIALESGDAVEPVWMFAEKDKALDTKGNIYLCRYQ